MATHAAAPGSVTVRPVERADLLAVFRIETASFAQPWPFSAFEEFLDAAGFLVAVRDGTVLGYVVADSVTHHGRTLGHVKDLAVHPDARGNGIGRHLLRRGLSALVAAGVTRAKLEVRETNHPALNLYRDEGFQVARRVSGYYADGEDALIMTIDLGAWQRPR